MANTVIGVYDNYANAQSALRQLLASGFNTSEVHLRPDEDTRQARSAALRAAGVPGVQAGSTPGSTTAATGTLRSFFHKLFSDDTTQDAPQMHADRYAEAVRRGSFVLTVDAATEQQRDVAASILEQFDAIDVDERALQWQAAGWRAHDETAAPLTEDEMTRERSTYTVGNRPTLTGTQTGSEQAAIPIIQEELQVGKREVQRGGVRVLQRVIETPVQETVNLRQEHVTVERHAVDQPATAADINAMKEGTIELREMAEEAVVAKTARIVEEVVIGKEVSETEATISDTVRRTDVEVEQLGTVSAASAATSGMSAPSLSAGVGDEDFRSHWHSAYGQTGEQYEAYAPAYQYGSTLANDPRYQGQSWSTSEGMVRQQWESANPHSTWDKVKDAVQYGWNKVAH